MRVEEDVTFLVSFGAHMRIIFCYQSEDSHAHEMVIEGLQTTLVC